MPVYEKRSPYFFRSKAAKSKSARQIAKNRMDWTWELSQTLEKWLDWPVVNFPNVGNSDGYYSDHDIEQIAQITRFHWKLGSLPIENLLRVIENFGVIVTREQLGHLNMDGVSRWYGNRPYMFLASDKANLFRGRFDAAHELGHLLLHKNIKTDDWNANYKNLEHQANLFAGAFLFPAECFVLEVNAPTLDAFLALKKRWKVSIAAMIMRSVQLGVINELYASRLWKNYSARHWRMKEPLDDTLLPEKPCLLSRALNMLVEHGEISKAQLIDSIGLSIADIESLCGTGDGWLSKQAKVDNVIQFKSYQK